VDQDTQRVAQREHAAGPGEPRHRHLEHGRVGAINGGPLARPEAELGDGCFAPLQARERPA
jgi:hypothetical protein